MLTPRNSLRPFEAHEKNSLGPLTLGYQATTLSALGLNGSHAAVTVVTVAVVGNRLET